MKLTDNSGGILLYTIIMSMVISFVCVSLSALTLSQFGITQDAIDRKQALNLTRAGFEYTYDLLGSSVPMSDLVGNGIINDDADGTFSTALPGHPDVLIEIDPANPPQGDPEGVNWRIVVTKKY